MKRRTIIIVIVVVLALAVSAYGIVSAQQKQKASSNDLKTYQVSYGSLSAVVDETGVVYADQSAMLYWETSGIVGDVAVRLGNLVSTDQVLATLRDDSLPQSVYLAQQELISAERSLEDLYEGADMALAQAKLDWANALDALDDAEYQWTVNQLGNRATPDALKDAKADVTITEKRLGQARKNLDKASGRVAKAQAQSALTDAKRAYNQAVWLLQWLQSEPTELEQALLDAELDLAKARLNGAEREWERLKDGPDPDDIALIKARIAAAEATLDQTTITAPFDSVITSVDLLPGDLVAPNTLAFRVDNLNNLLVDVGVSEVDINQIDVGQPVTLSFDAVLGKEYQGEVIEVSPVGIQQQGLVSFDVTIELLDADEDVRPGLTAAVEVVVRQVENALLVPNRAVRWVRGEQVVYLADAGENINPSNLKMVPVTLGASSDEFSELIDGEIKDGDLVVLNPPSISIFEEMEPGQGPPQGFDPH